MWIVSVLIVGSALGIYVVTGVNDLLAINRTESAVVNVKLPKNPDLDTVTNALYKKRRYQGAVILQDVCHAHQIGRRFLAGYI